MRKEIVLFLFNLIKFQKGISFFSVKIKKELNYYSKINKLENFNRKFAFSSNLYAFVLLSLAILNRNKLNEK